MADARANPDMRIRRVILLHGLWMPRAAMAWFARQLRMQGFAPEMLGYRSIFGAPEAAVTQLRSRLERGGAAALVGHSLGGLVALRMLAQTPAPPVRRVVCLGTPLSGSDAARALSRRASTALYMGRSGALLRRGCPNWPPTVEVGMIAGSLPHGLGALLARFDGPHDGTVAVAETCAPALAGHVVIQASHSGLLLSRAAVRQTAAFLRQGRFLPADPA